MSTHENPSSNYDETLRPIYDEPGFDDVSLSPEDRPAQAPTAAELALIERREVAVRTTNLAEQIIGEDVSIGALLDLAESTVESPERAHARRVLRCIHDISVENSVVLKAVGEVGVYHYAEGVILFEAGKRNYLELMDKFALSAEQVTGLYALRNLVEQQTDKKPSFPALLKAIGKVGLSVQDAADDSEAALEAFVSEGFFINYSGGRIFDRPIFAPEGFEGASKLGYHRDNIRPDFDNEEFVADFAARVKLDKESKTEE
jgi:hypothetical protein